MISRRSRRMRLTNQWKAIYVRGSTGRTHKRAVPLGKGKRERRKTQILVAVFAFVVISVAVWWLDALEYLAILIAIISAAILLIWRYYLTRSSRLWVEFQPNRDPLNRYGASRPIHHRTHRTSSPRTDEAGCLTNKYRVWFRDWELDYVT